MSDHAGRTVSAWMRSPATMSLPALAEDTSADVIVIGAGIAGLTTAYSLAKEGASVVVLEDGVVGGGETERTTAHISNALDDRYFELERIHGEAGARHAAMSHTAAIERIASIVEAESIDCELARVDGYLFLGEGHGPDLLQRELEACHRAGLDGVELLPRIDAPFDTGPVLRFPRQAQFHPTRYLQGLVHGIACANGRVHEHSHVETVEGGSDPHVIVRGGHRVRARDIVVATNTPFHTRFAIHTKQAPYRTYVIAARIPRGSMPAMLLWDTLDPYHYVRLTRHDEEHDLLIVGGEDHKTGHDTTPEHRWDALEKWARARFPQMLEVAHRWSGQVMEPVDGMAFIGRAPGDPEHVWVAIGDSGNGMTHGTIAGILLSDLIHHRPNPWADLYDPARVRLGGLRDFARENLDVAKEYTEWLRGGDVPSVNRIPPGSGAIVRRGARKLAVYRDPSGSLRVFSAACPHLGGVVQWNPAEKTFDCPLHGSRFTCRGEVVNGPANACLAEQELSLVTDPHGGDEVATPSAANDQDSSEAPASTRGTRSAAE
jgi:glycine/D-amino acid oxidase-like deaminating enzyme/nitrite reductase/ring-hydroxylating ferredoxin subunit